MHCDQQKAAEIAHNTVWTRKKMINFTSMDSMQIVMQTVNHFGARYVKKCNFILQELYHDV